MSQGQGGVGPYPVPTKRTTDGSVPPVGGVAGRAALPCRKERD